MKEHTHRSIRIGNWYIKEPLVFTCLKQSLHQIRHSLRAWEKPPHTISLERTYCRRVGRAKH